MELFCKIFFLILDRTAWSFLKTPSCNFLQKTTIPNKLPAISKILLIRFSAIGDIVLSSPVVRCLKKQLGAEIHYLSKHSFRPILEANPYIDKVYTIEKRVGEALPELRREKYDYLIDLHHNLRSFIVKINLASIKSFSFNKLNFEKWLLVHFKINRLPNLHIVDRYMETVVCLGVKNDGAGLDFFIEDNGLPTIWGLPKNYVAIVVGAGKNTKSLMVEQLVAIIRKSRQPIVLLGGTYEIEKANKIAASTINGIVNLVGKLTLAESALCIKYATKVITGDTGLMHIAAAFQKPIVSIWGNTILELGMYPYYGNHPNQNRIIEVKGLSCRPCSKIGFDQCPKGHFKCIKDLDLSSLDIISVKHLPKGDI